MKLKFYTRAFAEKPVQPAVDFTVDRYDWDVLGGPAQASLTARGDREQVWQLINSIREPVEIYSDRGDLVWYGYVEAVRISDGIDFEVSVETMSNNVAVAYTNGPERFTTAWSGDTDSIAEYGYKELLISHSDCTDADAISERDTSLAAWKNPIPSIGFGGRDDLRASITLRGWYQTFEWRYYQNLTGWEAYETTGDGGREIGEDERPILAMSFQIGASTAWTATTLWLRLWWQGDNQPTDNLNVSIRADNSGVPGTTLGSASIAGTAVDRSAEWTKFTLDNSVTLQPSTTYFIHIARSGAVDLDSYYMVDTNTANGYDRGAPIYYNTDLSAWVTAAHKGDVLFRLEGVIDTDSQIQALVTATGQFYTGTIIENGSNIETQPYRVGDSTGLYELEQLLQIGTSNRRRMLAETTPTRKLRVYEEPVQPAIGAAYGLGRDGVLYYPGTRNPVPAELCMVGMWCRLVDVVPATVDLSLIADPNMFYVEAAEYDGTYRITRTRNQRDIYAVGVEQG